MSQVPLDAILYAFGGFLGLTSLVCTFVVLSRIYKHGERRLAVILGILCLAFVGFFFVFLAGMRRANRLRLENVLSTWAVCFAIGIALSMVRLYLISEQKLTERFNQEQITRRVAVMGLGGPSASQPVAARPPRVWQTFLWPSGSSRGADDSETPVPQLSDAELAMRIRGEWRLEFTVRYKLRPVPFTCPKGPTERVELPRPDDANPAVQMVTVKYQGVLSLWHAGSAEFTGSRKGDSTEATSCIWKGTYELTEQTLRLKAMTIHPGVLMQHLVQLDPGQVMIDLPPQFRVEGLIGDKLTLRGPEEQVIICHRVR